MALAQALQACAMESEFSTGVLCDSAWELQRCMAPLLALSSDEIVEASLLWPIGEEHGTSPTPEEEAALLSEIKPPKVPEWLEVHEQVHPAEWTATPAASPPSPPPQPSHLPSQKAKKSHQEIKVDKISAGQLVCDYLEGNDRVPKWWREFQHLLQHPSDSPV